MLDSHDLFQSPTQTLTSVLDFLGLPAFTPDVDRALARGQNKGADCGNHEDHYVLAQVSVSVWWRVSEGAKEAVRNIIAFSRPLFELPSFNRRHPILLQSCVA